MRRKSDEEAMKDGTTKNLLIPCSLDGEEIFSLSILKFVLCQNYVKITC